MDGRDERAPRDLCIGILDCSTMQADNGPLNLDITVRVGCSLTYEVTGSASLLLNLKLAPDPHRMVLFEPKAQSRCDASGGVHYSPPRDEWVWRRGMWSGSNLPRSVHTGSIRLI